MKSFVKALMLVLGLGLLFGCGSGGGGSTSPKEGGATVAVLKLSTQGTLPAGTSIAGIGITVNLPAGMSVKTDSSGAVVTEAVAVSGVAAKSTYAPPVYVPATASAAAKLSFVLASSEAAGFGTGEFATVTCQVAAGTSPQATAVTLTDFKPVDLNGAEITGLTATHTMEIK